MASLAICCSRFCSSSGLHVGQTEFFQQHRQGFTQLEPVEGGVCEEESH